jgi:hypothetical protein
MIRITILLVCLALVFSQDTHCRFAFSYTQDEILHNATSQRRFVEDIIHWESQFIHKVGVET